MMFILISVMFNWRKPKPIGTHRNPLGGTGNEKWKAWNATNMVWIYDYLSFSPIFFQFGHWQFPHSMQLSADSQPHPSRHTAQQEASQLCSGVTSKRSITHSEERAINPLPHTEWSHKPHNCITSLWLIRAREYAPPTQTPQLTLLSWTSSHW